MPRQLTILFIALMLAVPLIGVSFVQTQTAPLERDAYEDLTSIADLKAEQIENWLREREGDCYVLMGSENLILRLAHFLANPKDETDLRIMRSRLEGLRHSYSYDSVLLVDPGKKLLLGSGRHTTVTPQAEELLDRALAERRAVRGELYRDANGHIQMDWVAPMMLPAAQSGQVIAAIVLRSNPEDFLYPMIESWPVSSVSGESLLARRDGDHSVALNNLRGQPDTALKFRMPLSQPNLPVTVAILAAGPRTMKGESYRDMPVLAAFRPVAGTDWSLVARINRDEVLAPM